MKTRGGFLLEMLSLPCRIWVPATVSSMAPTLLLLVALAPILALSASHALSAPDAVRGRFDAWAVEFGRSYSSADERETAFAAFQENDAEIEDHNRRGLSFQKGHNQFSDLTEQAWLSRFHTITPNRLGNYPDPRLPKTPVPASNSSFNWASKVPAVPFPRDWGVPIGPRLPHRPAPAAPLSPAGCGNSRAESEGLRRLLRLLGACPRTAPEGAARSRSGRGGAG